MVSPLMGIKSILVAFFLVLLGFSHEPIPLSTWLAAGLTALAVGLIGWPAKNSGSTSFKGIILAIASAASFSLLDSMVPHFSHQTDPVRMLFCIFCPSGISQSAFASWKEESIFRRNQPGDIWVWGSGIMIAFASGADVDRDCLRCVPTEVNVVYSSRGFWTIILVAWLGQRLCLTEGTIGKWVKIRRLAGSILLGVCILLIT